MNVFCKIECRLTPVSYVTRNNEGGEGWKEKSDREGERDRRMNIGRNKGIHVLILLAFSMFLL
jgi:hypothetical protein